MKSITSFINEHLLKEAVNSCKAKLGEYISWYCSGYVEDLADIEPDDLAIDSKSIDDHFDGDLEKAYKFFKKNKNKTITVELIDIDDPKYVEYKDEYQSDDAPYVKFTVDGKDCILPNGEPSEFMGQ